MAYNYRCGFWDSDSDGSWVNESDFRRDDFTQNIISKIDVATSLKIKFSTVCTPINECFFNNEFVTDMGCSRGEERWESCDGGRTGVGMKIRMNKNKTGFEMFVKSHQNLKPFYEYGTPDRTDLKFKPSWIRIDGLDIFLWEDEDFTNKIATFKIEQSIEAKKESIITVLEDKLKRFSPVQIAQKVKWATGSLTVSFKAFDAGSSRDNYSRFETELDDLHNIRNDSSNGDNKSKNKKPKMETKKSKKTNDNSDDGKKPKNKNPKMEIKKTKKADDEEKSNNKKPNTEVKKRVYKRKNVNDKPIEMKNTKRKMSDDAKKSNNKKPKTEVKKRKKANDNSEDEKKSKNKVPKAKVEIKKGKTTISLNY